MAGKHIPIPERGGVDDGRSGTGEPERAATILGDDGKRQSSGQASLADGSPSRETDQARREGEESSQTVEARHSQNSKREAGRSLNQKGQCCGRKPLVYKREPHLFCHRCCRSYNPETGRQIPNWAWKQDGDGFVPTYPDGSYVSEAR